ncbi:MAG: hypothetical protein AB7K52_04175 [Phycisphaerales bacterium]
MTDTPSNPTPQEPARPSDPSRPERPGIPLGSGSDVPASGSASRGPNVVRPKLSEESIIKLVENMPCPKCGADMAHDAVVCLKCGYDMTTGGVRSTKLGAPVEAPPQPESNDFSKPGRLGPMSLTIIGAIVIAFAAFFAGWNAPESATAGVRAARVGLLFLEALVHTGTGFVACAAVAVLQHQPLGRVDFAVARVFVALSAFFLITKFSYQPPEASTIVLGGIYFVQWVSAMAAYWSIAMALFWKSPTEAGMLGGIHLLMYLAFQLLVTAQAWLSGVAYPAAAAAAPA